MTTRDAYLAQAGLSLSRVGLGCAGLMRLPSRRARYELLAAAFDVGMRHYDVARMYGLGAAEAEVGRFAKARRDRLTIATKFGIEPSARMARLARFQAPARAVLTRVEPLRRAVKRRGDSFIEPRRYDADLARRSFDVSLRELGLEHVDILFVHDPGPQDDVATVELTAFFEELKAAGKIRAWGVSQDAHPGLDLVTELGPSAVLQIRQSVFQRSRRDDAVVAFGVLGGPLARISEALSRDPTRREAWAAALEGDPLESDRLPWLLLADALNANPRGAVLVGTIKPERVRVARRVLEEPPSPEMLGAFRSLVNRLPPELVTGT